MSSRYRAPAEDGATLTDPPLSEAGPLLAENRSLLESATVTIDGTPLPEYRRQARAEAIRLACRYLEESDQQPPAVIADGGLLLSGHQPEWFHPGVWVKNFALNGLARRHGLTPLNLVVDNDAVKSTSLRFPCPNLADPTAVHLTSLPFDRFAAGAPWEERTVQDEALFRSFAQRAAPLWRGWGFAPMLPEVWPDVLRRHERSPLAGECFAAVRRDWERRWGCFNLELPLSRLCGSEAFARFVRQLLANLPAFHAAYNACVREYRERHGIRSRNHPVPDLAREGDRYELPLWAWRPGDARRGRLLLAPGEPVPAGVKLRTRALMTTLFARVCLGDGFIHGIGGGLYDEVTDALISRWLGLRPPRYLVLTATLRLPVAAFPTRPVDVRSSARVARDLVWNPQRHLSEVVRQRPEIRRLVDRRLALIQSKPAGRRERKAWFRSLREVTDMLRPAVADQLVLAERQRDRRALELRANRKLLRRDFAWCLFPEEMLRGFYQRFLDPSGSL